MKDLWWDRKAKEIQEAADKNTTKLFYEGPRAVYGLTASGNASVYSSDGKTLLTDKTIILNRWA